MSSNFDFIHKIGKSEQGMTHKTRDPIVALKPISSVLMWILCHFTPFSKQHAVIVVKSDRPVGEEYND